MTDVLALREQGFGRQSRIRAMFGASETTSAIHQRPSFPLAVSLGFWVGNAVLAFFLAPANLLGQAWRLLSVATAVIFGGLSLVSFVGARRRVRGQSDTIESDEEKEARRFFEVIPLTVTRIATATTQTADYFIDGDAPGYAVEVKTRLDNADALRALHQGEAVDGERPLAHDAALERVARSARKQLQAIDPAHDRLWMLWFSLRAVLGADVSFQQCVGTLYGIRDCVFDENGIAKSMDCFYARPGVFERWTEIDGALISTGNGFAGCVNELSPRADLVLGSRVMTRLGKAIVVPSRMESEGSVFIADRSVNRKETAALQDSLSAKYRRQILVVDFTHAWAAKAVSDKERGRE